MDALLRLLLTNAAAAGLLALGAWAASRLVQRPAVVHGLWLLALARLVTPPVLPLPVLPEWRSPPAVSGAPAVAGIAPRAGAGPIVAAPVRSAAPAALAVDLAPPQRGRAAAGPEAAGLGLASRLVLLIGLIATTWLTARRFARFRRLLEHAVPAPAPVVARAAEIAHRLRLRRVPPVLLVPARIPPMLWPASGGPRLLIPGDLLPQLREEERDALLAHELAHLRRRDHWVRLLEVATTALFWWYPVTWWARGALRRAEERCCDEWVLRLLPASASAYAEGLLKSLTFVSREGVALPAAASGAGPARDLETRLKEILMTRPRPQLGLRLRLALAAGAAVGLAVFPTQAQTRSDPPEDRTPPAPAAAPRAAAPPSAARAIAARPSHRPARLAAPAATALPALAAAPAAASTAPTVAATAPQAPAPATARGGAPDEVAERELEAQRRALEKERRALRDRQRALERQSLELESLAEQEEMRAEAARLRAQGSAEQAAVVEKRIAAAKGRFEVMRRRLELEAEQAALEGKLEQVRQEREGRARALEEAGREAEAESLRRKAERFQAEEERAAQALHERQEQMERELREAEERMQVLAVEEHVHQLRAGTDELARSLAEHVAALKETLPRAAEKEHVEREIRRLEAAIAALEKTP